MGKIVKYHLPCKSCASSDAVCTYDDGSTYCFSCRKYTPDAASVINGTAKLDFEPEAEDVARYSRKDLSSIAKIEAASFGAIPKRKISAEVVEFFGVRIAFSADGKDQKHAYPYDVDEFGIAHAYKTREVATKTFSSVGKMSGLFGRHLFAGGGKRLVITEGEIDALSVAQASMDKYGKIYPVVSLRSATAVNDLLKELSWIKSFGEVVLCMDNDEAGQIALKEATKIIGFEKAKIAEFGKFKDPNEVLVKEGVNALHHIIWDAQPYIPSGIIAKDKLWEALKSYNEVTSQPYPKCLDSLNLKLKGRRLGELDLFISGSGCLGKDTGILMIDGSIKKVQDIEVNDVLMGPDNLPRTVTELKRGVDKLFEVSINEGKQSFICNSTHILSLKKSGTDGRYNAVDGEIVDVSMRDFLLKWSARQRYYFKTFKSEALEFSPNELPIHPYILGTWLGDGYSEAARLSAHDSSYEMLDKIEFLGQPLVKHKTIFSYGMPDRLSKKLISLNVLNNKHIPEIYLTSCIEDRLELLAGLLDTDGSYDSNRNIYEFSQKSELITDQFIRLCGSLGLHTSKNKQKNNKFGNCFRVYVSGHLANIPVALSRKKARDRKQIKDPLRFATNVKYIGEGDFYGFSLTGDGRFVLDNFIVTHNSGKSTVFRELILSDVEQHDDKVGIISLEEAPEETARRLVGMALNINTAERKLTDEQLEAGFNTIFGTDRLLLLDHQGSVADDSLLDTIEYMALMGCKYIYLDHITIAVSEGANNLTGNEAIDYVMGKLLKIVKKHNVWLGVISHLRKSQAGHKSFEEGEMPSMDDIKGSGSIKQISFAIIAFSRKQFDDDPINRSTIRFCVLKNRYAGVTGMCDSAYYNVATGRLQTKVPQMMFDSEELPYDTDDAIQEIVLNEIAFKAMAADYYLE